MSKTSRAQGPLRFVLKLALVVLVLGAIAVGILRSPPFSRFVAKALEVAVERATGENAVVGSVQVEPLRLKLEVEGFLLSHPDAAPDQPPIALVERIEASLGLDGFEPVLRTLVIERPRVALHLEEGKLVEFQNAPTSSKGGPRQARFPWRELVVEDGTFSIASGEDFHVNLLDIDVATESEGTMFIGLDKVSLQVGPVEQEANHIWFRKVLATPERIIVPEIDLAFEDLTITGSFGLIAGQAINLDLVAETELERWDELMGPRVRATGKVTTDIAVIGDPKAPEISGALVVESPDLFVMKASGTERAYHFGRITSGWAIAGRELRIDPFVLHWTGGIVEVHGAVDLGTKVVQASVMAEDLAFAEILRAVGAAPNPWVDFHGDAEVQVAGNLSPLELYGSFDLAIVDLVVEQGPVDKVNELVLGIPKADAGGQLRMDDHGIRLEAWEAGTRDTRGHVVATIGFGPVGPLDVDFDMSVNYAELQPLGGIGLAGRGRMAGHFAGPFNQLKVEATADSTPFSCLETDFADHMSTTISSDMRVLSLDSFRAVKGETVYGGSLQIDFPHDTALDLQILIDKGRLSDIAGMWLDIPNLEADVTAGTISLVGPPFQLDGEGDLTFGTIDLFGETFDRGLAHGVMKDGRFTLDDLRVTRADGAEALVARGTVKEQWKSHFEVVSGGLRLQTSDLLGSAAEDMEGTVHLDMVVDGTLFVPEPRGRIAVAGARLLDQPLEASTLYFDTEDGVLSFEGGVLGAAMGVAGTLELWDEQNYFVELDMDDYPVSVFFPEGVNGGEVSARAWGGVLIEGAFGDHPTPVDINAEVTRFVAEWEGHRLESVETWRYMQHGKNLEVSALELSGGDTSFTFEGKSVAGGTHHFSGGGTVDLDLLRLVVPGLEASDGLADVTILFEGQKDDVDASVRVAAEDARFEGDWFPATLEDVDFAVDASPDGYELRQVAGRFGGGDFQVSGTIGAEGWIPKRYDLSGVATDTSIRWFDFLPPVRGDARLTFRGPSTSLLLSGRIDVESMVFNERITWEDWVLELEETRLEGSALDESAALFSMNIDILAPETIQARNNLAELTASANLRLVGDTARPGMVGDVRALSSGKVFFKEREFDLNRGEIHFLDPYSYDPELDFAMVTTVKTREQEYDIDYWITGPFSDWRASTSSSPALSQADINAVLLFGMTGEEFERYGGIASALALEGGGILASKVASDLGLADQVDEGFFQLVPGLLKPDRIDIQTGVGERAIGSVTSDVRIIAEKDVWDDGTLLFEQNLSDTEDRYLGLEQRLARRLYATGYWAQEEIGREVSSVGAFGAEFNVRWELD